MTATCTDRTDRATASREKALDDACLVRRFISGDETAFTEIVIRHRERMFSVAFSLLRNHADAEEITQDTFIRAHRGLANFRGESSLATWLHCIASNLARNRYWYFHRRCRHVTVSLDTPVSSNSQSTFSDFAATEAPSPIRELVANEFSDLIGVCMKRLDARAREVLTLRNSMNLSYADISSRLGISLGTVKSRVARARERLRVLLAESSPDFGRDADPKAWFEFSAVKRAG